MSLLFSIFKWKARIPRKEPGRTHTHTSLHQMVLAGLNQDRLYKLDWWHRGISSSQTM